MAWGLTPTQLLTEFPFNFMDTFDLQPYNNLRPTRFLRAFATVPWQRWCYLDGNQSLACLAEAIFEAASDVLHVPESNLAQA